MRFPSGFPGYISRNRRAPNITVGTPNITIWAPNITQVIPMSAKIYKFQPRQAPEFGGGDGDAGLGDIESLRRRVERIERRLEISDT